VHGDKRSWREDHAHVPRKHARDRERDTKRKTGDREDDDLHMGLQAHRHATISADHKLHTQNRAYLAERSANLRPVVPEPYLHKRPVPRIAVLEFIRDVPRRASLPIPSPELRARHQELGDAAPVPADGGPVQWCASVNVRRVRVRAVSEEHARRDFVALVHGPVQCRAALAVAFVG
jgi:hypothetical protein